MTKNDNKIKNLKIFSTTPNKKYSLEKSKYYAIIGVSIFQILAFGVLPKVWYRPDNREMNQNNLFLENTVIISEEEQQPILERLERELGIAIEDNKENYLLLNAVLENPYLTGKEKEIFYKFIEYFNDNPYINREQIYENILNVNARFALRKSMKKEENVLAIYLPEYRDIIYFELFPIVDTMSHEDGHCIHDSRNTLRSISEGMTQIISSEYFSETPFLLTNNYPYEVSFVKLLCEMIGTDKVLQSYTEDKPEIIYDSLDALIGEKDKAKTVLEDLDWCLDCYGKGTAMTLEESNKAGETLLSFLKYVNECNYQDKDAFQYHLSVLVSAFTNHYGNLEDYQKIVLCKSYLSSQLKENGYTVGEYMNASEYLGENYQK